jgi:LEA14-like dessication related protein
MKKGLYWGLGLGTLAIIGVITWRYYSTQIGKLFQYSWSINSIKLTTIGGGKLGLAINAKLTNPSEIKATISNMFIKIYLGGVFVGTVTDIDSFTIEPQGSYDLPLNIDFLLSNLSGNWVDLARKLREKKDLPLVFDGYATVQYKIAKVKAPFRYETTVKDYLFS